MKKTAVILALILSLNASAEGLKHIPRWHMVGEKACYDFRDAQTLLVLDSQLEMFMRKDAVWHAMLVDFRIGVDSLNKAFDAQERVKATLLLENDGLGKRLMAETARANKAEVQRADVPLLIGLGSGLFVLGVLGGILLGVYVSK